MRQSVADPALDIAGVLDADTANSCRFCDGGKVRVFEVNRIIEEAGRFLFDLDKTERAVVEDDHLDRKL